ncbi:MAG: YjbH domain-containing protein [Bacteroidota bacterium]
MKHSLKSCFIIGLYLLCLSSYQSLSGQDWMGAQSDQWKVEQEVISLLEDEGFQNIAVRLDSTTFQLTFENRLYRFEPTAIRRIIELISRPLLNSEAENLVLLVQSQGVVLMSVELPVTAQLFYDRSWALIGQQMKVELLPSTQPSFSKKMVNNSGNYSFELSVLPGLRLALGGQPDPLAYELDLRPRLTTYLWKGAKLKTELILPISTELNIAENKMVRPGLLAFQQFIRLPKNVLMSVSAGYFSDYRYGAEMEVGRFWLNGRLFLNARLGRTGYASYPIRLGLDEPEKGWQFSPLSYWNYYLGAAYRIPRWDLTVELSYAKALYNQQVVELSCTRQFNELDIGFFAYRTEEGDNYGFRLSVPIFPAKYFRPGRFHFRPAKHFEQRYQGSLHFASHYETGGDLRTYFKKLNPDFVKSQISNRTQ